MPPKTTTHRMMMDSHSVKLAGLIKVVLAANTTPAIPAQVAPMANALSLVLVLSIPMAWQATSSSRRAIQALPIRESCSRRTTKMVARARSIITKYI